MATSRSKNTLRNFAVAFTMQILSILLSFFCRTIFANLLSKEYLGLGGLFTNIISVLSLSELGIASVILVHLYKPIAENDTDRVCKLMNFYKLAYRIIGIFIILCGLILTPFLGYLVKTDAEIPFLKFYFLLFILQSASSYFFAYKQSIFIASQQEYICSLIRQFFHILSYVLQILVLILTKSYTFYLLVSIFTIFATNLTISQMANKKFPYLTEKKNLSLEKWEIKDLLKDVSSMMLHKVGTVVINSTDNILISSMIGIVFAGLYSNYLLIVNVIVQIITIAFSAISASVGDFNARKSAEESYELFTAMNLVSFWGFGMCAICLFTLFQPTIGIWLGEDFLLSDGCVALIVINFFLSGVFRVPSTFIDLNGLYTKTKFKPIASAIINLVTSILFIRLWGLIGVFIGTLISHLALGLWVDPYFLTKYKFPISLKRYFLQFSLNTIVVAVIGGITYFAVSIIPYYILKVLVCGVLSNLLFFAVYHKTEAFRFIWSRLKAVLIKKRKIS